MVLPECGHSLCNDCCSKLQDKKCPFCRAQFISPKPNFAVGGMMGIDYVSETKNTFNYEEQVDSLIKYSKWRRDLVEERIFKLLINNVRNRIATNPLWAGYLMTFDRSTLKECCSDVCNVERIIDEQALEVLEKIKKRLMELNKKHNNGILITSITKEKKSLSEDAHDFCFTISFQVTKD